MRCRPSQHVERGERESKSRSSRTCAGAVQTEARTHSSSRSDESFSVCLTYSRLYSGPLGAAFRIRGRLVGGRSNLRRSTHGPPLHSPPSAAFASLARSLSVVLQRPIGLARRAHNVKLARLKPSNGTPHESPLERPEGGEGLLVLPPCPPSQSTDLHRRSSNERAKKIGGEGGMVASCSPRLSSTVQ